MKKRLTHLFLVFLLIAPAFVHAAAIDENIIKQMITEIDKAIAAKDATGIAKSISPNVQIVLNVSTQGKKQVMSMTKDQYLKVLQDGWSMSQNYKYSRANMKIKLENPNRAVVTADVFESMTVNGQKISGSSKEEVYIELINDTPLITKIVGHTTM